MNYSSTNTLLEKMKNASNYNNVTYFKILTQALVQLLP